MFSIRTNKQMMCKFTIVVVAYITLHLVVAPSFADPAGLSEIIAVDIGNDGHCLALMSNGTVWTWGINTAGQCGEAFNDSHPILVPTIVSGISDVKAVASGEEFSMALKNDGTVWAWGDNSYGEMGIEVNTTDEQANKYPRPVQITGLDHVVAIDAGNEFAIALKNDGTVWTWGDNEEGTLGNGQPAGSGRYNATPAMIKELKNVKAIYAGNIDAMALTNDGELWAWGHNSYLLGGRVVNVTPNTNIPSSASSVPGILFSMSDIKSVTIGEDHAALLKNDGTVWTWGSDWRGKLGNGSSNYNNMYSQDMSYTPIQVPGLTNITAIAAGIEHTVALKDDGTTWTWGGNEGGQIGDGTMNDRNKPFQIPISNTTTIAAGGGNTAIIDEDGVLKMCGADTVGQLGDGLNGNFYKGSLQTVSFGFIVEASSTISPIVSVVGAGNSSSGGALTDNIVKIAALLVIVVILGAGALFYIKKK